MGKARLAAIDVGSNAMRLRVVERTNGGGSVEVASERAAVRLGRDVFATGALSPDTIDRACAALGAFRARIDRLGVSAHRAVATSATREAANGALFVARARREAEIELEVIDGIEEARLVQLGVAGAVRLVGRTALIDIGGGSTEVTLLEGSRRVASASLPLGTVRLLEAWHPTGGAIGRRRLGVLSDVVDRAIAEDAPSLQGVDRVVATGGTVTALAKLCGKDEDELASAARLDGVIDRLRRMTEPERTRTYGLRADRSDTIVPAAVVLRRVLAAAGIGTFVAPGVGLRDGLIAELGEPSRSWPSAAPRERRESAR